MRDTNANQARLGPVRRRLRRHLAPLQQNRRCKDSKRGEHVSGGLFSRGSDHERDEALEFSPAVGDLHARASLLHNHGVYAQWEHARLSEASEQ